MDIFSDSEGQKKLCFAIIIVLLVLIVLQLRNANEVKEHLVQTLGRPTGDIGSMGKNTSGATQAHMSIPTGTNEGRNTVISNVDIGDVTHGRLSGTGFADASYLDGFDKATSSCANCGQVTGCDCEHLVSTRGMPDFWEIGSELRSYQRSQLPGVAQAAKAQAPKAQAAEHMAGGTYDAIGQHVFDRETGKVWN